MISSLNVHISAVSVVQSFPWVFLNGSFSSVISPFPLSFLHRTNVLQVNTSFHHLLMSVLWNVIACELWHVLSITETEAKRCRHHTILFNCYLKSRKQLKFTSPTQRPFTHYCVLFYFQGLKFISHSRKHSFLHSYYIFSAGNKKSLTKLFQENKCFPN